MAKKFIANDTNKEERTYEPFKGAKMEFIKELEKKEKEEQEEKEETT